MPDEPGRTWTSPNGEGFKRSVRRIGRLIHVKGPYQWVLLGYVGRVSRPLVGRFVGRAHRPLVGRVLRPLVGRDHRPLVGRFVGRLHRSCL